ncbi:hypothetical protein DFH06DRAFT_335615 [Mycena polygramma]|nr:hypothetical protein DFH06DRAFT_335615 [Mycena polygramma]
MSFANALHRAAELAKLYCLIFICSPFLAVWCVASLRAGRSRRHGYMRELFVLPYPSPLPTKRIEIAHNRIVAEQPPSCHLLHLPPELRSLIFELAVGNRLVHLKMVPNERINELMIRTSCYMLSEATDTPNRLLIPADNISVAVLRTCRSVYLEVLPIVHRRNTFYFHLEDFRPAIECGLGEYCLSDLRSVYLYHCGYPDRPRWDPAFGTLQRMRLHSLALEFEILEWTEVHPSRFSVDNAWCRSLLAIRRLRNLDIFFRRGNPADNPLHRETIRQTLRDLMIGPAADDKYNALLLAR